MNKEFEAFKKTLSPESLKAIYDETKIEVSESETEGTEAYSVAVASIKEVDKKAKEHAVLKEKEKKKGDIASR